MEQGDCFTRLPRLALQQHSPAFRDKHPSPAYSSALDNQPTPLTRLDMPDWQPSAKLETLRQRAQLLSAARAFFAARNMLEVETPVLSAAASTEIHLASLVVRSPHDTPVGYLQTSPEYFMKRLLAAGAGPIWQIARVFRADEAGRRHNPEFTMLEWYRVGFDHHQLMDEVAELVRALLPDGATRTVEKLSYRDAFLRHAQIDPLIASGMDLARCAATHGISPPASLSTDEKDAWLDLLLTHLIEPHLGRGWLTFLFDYPASQASLARLSPENPVVAERFELYVDGVELANGFHELGDSAEQRRRFEEDNRVRHARGLPVVPIDTHLLAALTHGLPPCAGVALGFDRLVMLATGASHIQEVLAFPADRL
jgi:lysyl-tRNA synthetase class 2